MASSRWPVNNSPHDNLCSCGLLSISRVYAWFIWYIRSSWNGARGVRSTQSGASFRNHQPQSTWNKTEVDGRHLQRSNAVNATTKTSLGTSPTSYQQTGSLDQSSDLTVRVQLMFGQERNYRRRLWPTQRDPIDLRSATFRRVCTRSHYYHVRFSPVIGE